MRYLKILGLAAVAAAALMALASPASATSLTSPSGTTVTAGTTIHAVNENGHVVLDSLAGKIECSSTVQGKTDNESGPTISGSLSTLSFTGCTTATVHVLKAGSLSITGQEGNKGTLTSTGAEVTVVTFGLHCIFSTNNTVIGTITGSASATSDATLDISATIPRTGGTSGAFCGASAPWTGNYRVTKPTPLFIHQ